MLAPIKNLFGGDFILKRLLSITMIATMILLTSCGTKPPVTESNQQPIPSISQEASNTQTTPDTSVAQNTSEEIIPASDMSKLPEVAKSRTDTVIAGIKAPGGVFLPNFYDNGWDGNASTPVFAPLVNLDGQGKPIPGLADTWTISPDNLVYTFHIRDGAKFSDGTPVTSDDIGFTLTLLNDPAYAGFLDMSLANIQGAEEYKKGNAESISGIKMIDPQTIEITTTKASALALLYLGNYSSVYSKNYYGKEYKKGNIDYLKNLYGTPMGAGPYKLEKYIPGQELRYVANENYYGGKPAVEHFIYKVTSNDTKMQLMQAGETDYDGFPANEDNIEQLKQMGFVNLRLATVADYGYVYMNNTKPFFKDTLVRQAMIYGLDREKCVAATYNGFGQVANIPTSPLSWSYTTDGINTYEFNPEKAKQLLDEAGWKVGADGIREKDGVKFKITYITSTQNDEFIPIAQQNYKDIGIQLDPQTADFNALMAKLTSKDYDMAAVRSDTILDPNDAVKEFSSTFAQNNSGYNNPNADKLIADGASTTDIEQRKQIYTKLYQELSNNPPVIYMNYRRSCGVFSGRLDNFVIDGYNGIGATLSSMKIK